MTIIKTAAMLIIALFILLIEHFSQSQEPKQQDQPSITDNTDKENSSQTIK